MKVAQMMERALQWNLAALKCESRDVWNPCLGPSLFRKHGRTLRISWQSDEEASVETEAVEGLIQRVTWKNAAEFLRWWNWYVHLRVREGAHVWRVTLEFTCRWIAELEQSHFRDQWITYLAEMAALMPVDGSFVLQITGTPVGDCVSDWLRLVAEKDGGSWIDCQWELPNASRTHWLKRRWHHFITGRHHLIDQRPVPLPIHFAVVITTYRRPDGSTPSLIGDALARVLHQTHDSWSVFVMGDRYEDKSHGGEFGQWQESTRLTEVLKSSNRAFFRNMTVALERDHQPPLCPRDMWCLGGAGTMNAGMTEAHRRLVLSGWCRRRKGCRVVYCPLDDDDLWHPEHLARLATAYRHQLIQPLVVTVRTWMPPEWPSGGLPQVPWKQSGLPHADNWIPMACTAAHSAWSYDLTAIQMPLRTVDDPNILSTPPGRKPMADADCLNRLRMFLLSSADRHSLALCASTCWHESESCASSKDQVIQRRWWYSRSVVRPSLVREQGFTLHWPAEVPTLLQPSACDALSVGRHFVVLGPRDACCRDLRQVRWAHRLIGICGDRSTHLFSLPFDDSENDGSSTSCGQSHLIMLVW